MKKIISVTLFLILTLVFCGPAMAIDFITANQVTIGWDPVTTSADGSFAFPDGEITYNVYLSNAATDPNKSNPEKVGTVAENQYTLTLNVEGKFIAGVSAVRTVGGVEIGESAISWSDESDPPFGIQFYKLPPAPTGLSPK